METDIKQLIQEVLEKGYLMSLAIVDTGGVWVADVVYIHDDELNIYWMSDPDSRHSLAILGNNRVAATITVNSQGEDNLGIQLDGVAEKLDGDRHDLAIKHFAKRKKPEPSSDEDILQGDSWYILKPKNIDLIYEKLYGFKKQKFEL